MSGEAGGGAIWLRPEQASVGRPAQRSRAEITAAAVAIADRDGLDAVSMRRVAAQLGTGAASLYRYLDTREDLLDLMSDSIAAEYAYPAATGDWLADLISLGEQGRAILRRHRWLVTLVITRPALGPNGLVLLEYFLDRLVSHPASLLAKLEAFAMLNTITAVFVQNELAGGSAVQQRNASYLQHAAGSGGYPRLAHLLAQTPAGDASPADPYPGILARTLTGLLGPEPPRPAALAGPHDVTT
jgi:AcrR family transcriptional regulator